MMDWNDGGKGLGKYLIQNVLSAVTVQRSSSAVLLAHSCT